MNTSTVISAALEWIKSRLIELEAEREMLHNAEQALSGLVQQPNGQLAPSRSRAPRPTAASELAEASTARTRRRRGGMSVKAEILAAIELAGEEGIQGDELAQLLPHVAPATMSATLSVLR